MTLARLLDTTCHTTVRTDPYTTLSAINPAASDTTLGFDPGQPVGIINISGLQQFQGGLGAIGEYDYHYNSFQGYDDFYWTKGKHLLKVGFSVERIQDNQLTRGANPNGQYKLVVDLYLKPLLLGEDPWDVEFLWQHMFRKTMAFGRRGIGMVAISAVDIALWDILGKSARQPVYRLLGGRTKPKIPVYASRLYSMELDKIAAEAEHYKKDGYQAMKLRFGWGPVDGAAGMRRNVELVRTVRQTVGDEIDVMADAYMGWTLDYAKRMLPLLEPFQLRWLEEPVLPDDIHGYAELKSYGRVPIAGGEHEFTLHGFRDLLEAKAVDYIQFDTNRVGGITQARKIAALAEAHSVPVIPHAGQMHNYHVVMASLNSPMAEYFPIVDVEVGNELFWYIFEGEPQAKEGFVDLDENVPGLGVTINESALRNFEVSE